MSQYPAFPRILQKFRNLPGQYGTMELIAKSAQLVELAMTREFVQLNRDDAQELIRVLAAWLAGEPDTQVIETRGAGSAVVVVDNGPGSPNVSVVDKDPPSPPPGRHYEPLPELIEEGPRVRTPR